MQQITVIKVGGKVIEHQDSLSHFCEHIFSFYPHCILIHGGGVLANELASKLNIPVQMHQGRRITDKAMLDIAVMTYAGIANKQLVAMLQTKNIDACGLSGCDMNIIVSHKRIATDIDWGLVGDIDSVDAQKLKLLLDHHIMPVISPITYNKEGHLLNTNADSVAASVAVAMSKWFDTQLIYCFDKPGVLQDINNPTSVVPTINQKLYSDMKNKNIIHSGMIPKLDNAFKTISLGVSSVRLTDTNNLNGGTQIHLY